MSEGWIDLRSDTVTLPTPAMRRAMAEAELGDDVFGEDPTVQALEEEIAGRLGKEAGLFVPSGTMSNQIAVRIHARSGDALICERDSHLFVYEAGGPAALSGVTCLTTSGRRGIIDVADVEGLIHPSDVHRSPIKLLALENTHNRGGGSIYPIANIERLTNFAREKGLAAHLDGARLMNAVVATGVSANRWASGFDTVSICFSKGLGAPVGSALVGPRALIKEARRVRKLFGGGMRQAGVIAAAALFALRHHVERLAEDHANARIIAEAFEAFPGFELRVEDVQTNMLWVGVSNNRGAAAIVEEFKAHGVLCLALGPQSLRMVTHLGISQEDAGRVAEVVRLVGKGALS